MIKFLVGQIASKAPTLPNPSQSDPADWKYWVGVGVVLAGMTWREWSPKLLGRFIDKSKRVEEQEDKKQARIDDLQDKRVEDLEKQLALQTANVEYWRAMAMELLKGGDVDVARRRLRESVNRDSLHGATTDEVSEVIEE